MATAIYDEDTETRLIALRPTQQLTAIPTTAEILLRFPRFYLAIPRQFVDNLATTTQDYVAYNLDSMPPRLFNVWLHGLVIKEDLDGFLEALQARHFNSWHGAAKYWVVNELAERLGGETLKARYLFDSPGEALFATAQARRDGEGHATR